MAFGFIKKVFSFGKKEVEETKPDEAEEIDATETAAATQAVEALTGEKPAPEPEPEVEEPDAAPATPSPRERGEGEDEGQRDAYDITPAAEAAPTSPTEGAGPSSDPSGHLLPAGGEKEAEPASEVAEETVAEETPEPKAEKPDATPATPSPRERGEGEDEGRGAAVDLEARSPDAAPAVAAGKIAISKSVERVEEKAIAPEAPEPRKPWFQRLREGLSRSSRELRDSISGIFTKRKLDDDTLQDLEDVLLRADLGLETAMRVTDALASGRYGKDVSGEEVQAVMAEEIEKVLAPVAMPLELDLSHKPHVILVVGVNGTGKTTTIGKLAAKLTEGGLKVTLGAGDTFRAAAIEQLKIWGERTGSPVVSSKLGADAAGLAYDAFEKAKEAGSDVLIIDTAGRLQNKTELMAELEKIVRVLGKHDPDAPHTVLQTVDATTGQNALNQVEIFRNVAGVNGLVMTKLDGTARGGILVSIAAKHKLPVYFIGVGEQVDDLEPFSASDFAKAIAGVQ
ncbi:signal recognition particle-docking protein FtsY [Nitratireductor sp. GISD-1A_MAKvit]|uniref:signal recognition particle-docking protein FtsY n=1 Tax=Nitratireductor sp. GISD-1A_MAKvit TaxID=3234198 RepID=UPI003466F10D